MSSSLPPLSAFLKRVAQSLADGSFAEVRLHPTQGVPTTVRQINLREGPALSFVTHEARQDLTHNHTLSAGQAELERLLTPGGTAWLSTTDKAWQLVAPTGQRARLVAHATPAQNAPSREHNRIKHHHLRDAGTWLQALDLTDRQGHPRVGRADKVHQIERYSDLLAHLAREAGWTAGQSLTVADMGCGKGYLTFAAWQVLRHELKLDAQVLGLDAQPGVIASCTATVQSIQADGLSFRVGSIATAELPPLDMLIALHACNDATDQALVRGVTAGARLLVVAPCCHKDIRRALGTPVPLGPLLQYGLFKERFAEWLTDGLRVLALEAAGYRVTVSEFVDAVHTPKNVLIGAVRGQTPERRAAAKAEFIALKTWAGLTALPLDALLPEEPATDH